MPLNGRFLEKLTPTLALSAAHLMKLSDVVRLDDRRENAMDQCKKIAFIATLKLRLLPVIYEMRL